jgi:uncharacterized membrane protein
MLSRYPLDPFARPDSPDLPGLPVRIAPAGVARRLREAAIVAGAAAALTLALTLILFLPVAADEISRLESVVVNGVSEPAGAFTDRLVTLFLGLLVLSASVSAFVLSVLMTPPSTRPIFPAGGRGSARLPRRGKSCKEHDHVQAL